ncbi:MAG: hypothetical protein K0R05_1232 [Anaerocolumna sp.]|nr:hypothetical protein [Anaerocolumna sp.]
MDDDLRSCLSVLLFKDPYSTKAPVTVHGRLYSAKLAVQLRLWLVIVLRQWHYLTYSQFLALKCHKEPFNTKLLDSSSKTSGYWERTFLLSAEIRVLFW